MRWPVRLLPPSRFVLRIAIGLLLAVGIFAGTGSIRIPSGPAMGTSFHPPRNAVRTTAQAAAGTTAFASQPRAAAGRIRLGTFNIHGCKSDQNVYDFERTARCLAGLDFVALNEVHGPFCLETMNQAEMLGNRLGMDWLFAPTERRWWHYDFGNGALASVPVTHWQVIPVDRNLGKSYRNMLLARLDLGGVPLQVLVVHLDRSSDAERLEQLRAASSLFFALAEPAVVMGDFNTGDDEPAMASLLAAPGVHDVLRDRLGDEVPPRVDWILTRGLHTLDAGIVDDGTSDHPHVWAELEWSPAEVAARPESPAR